MWRVNVTCPTFFEERENGLGVHIRLQKFLPQSDGLLQPALSLSGMSNKSFINIQILLSHFFSLISREYNQTYTLSHTQTFLSFPVPLPWQVADHDLIRLRRLLSVQRNDRSI